MGILLTIFKGEACGEGSGQKGFSLLEILITMLIVSIGLMGLATLMTRIHIASMEAYQRTQALILLSDITERLNVNRSTLSCFAFTTDVTTNGTPYIGVPDTGWALPSDCAASTTVYNIQADNTIIALNAQLQGAAELKSGATTGSGAMVGARACISYNTADVLNDSLGVPIAGTGSYTITVVWQGMASTQAPTAVCANGLYGATDGWRRAVTTTIRFANLNSAQLERGRLFAWL